MRKTIGVLALQGDFERHQRAVERAGGRAVEARTAAQMEACDGLILPGGESTTMLKLLDLEGLTEPLRRFGASKPIFGTCAGAILLARAVTHPVQPSLGLMDIEVERNAYGRQVDSRIVRIALERGAEGAGAQDAAEEVEAVFIRAPIIRRVGPEVEVLARYEGNPVWAAQGLHMVTTFHPELTGDERAHRVFLSRIPD